jgi:Fe-S cluster biogenesis protein NfuA/nitrite reductase/ring-hydroxylating ferredoxin subunit
VAHGDSPEAGADSAAGQSDALAATGERIATLLDASAAGGEVARRRAEDLVALVTNLYGAGLERMLDVLADVGRLDQTALDALADDDLVASLLLVHGLHPYDVTTRVGAALDSVRPYLGSHGGDVELVEVAPDGVVRIRLLGSCDGCPSSSVTLQLAVEGAIEAAAPEVTSIEVEASPSGASGPTVIPVDALRARLNDATTVVSGSWTPVPELAELAAGEVGGFDVDGTSIVACRLGPDLFAYLDHCPACGRDLAGARLERPLGQPVGAGVLTCRSCRTHYDVRLAGAAVDDPGVHLDPLPLLVRDGVLAVAVPVAVTA